LSSLKDKAVKGVIWSAAERFGNQFMQFFIGLLLARLLLPQDYGLVGMLLVFISIAQVFVDGGFSSALIQKNEPSEEDYSTVFWFNLVTAVFFYLAIFFCSPLIAQFYDEPMLAPLAKIVGLNIIINAFGIIQKTKLTKGLDFKTQAKINISSIVIGGIIGVIAAWQGYGVWALVIQNLFRSGLMNLIFWVQSSWRPKRIFSKTSFKALFGFGSKLLAASIFNTISENVISLIIGKFYDTKSLGYYTRALQFQKFPINMLGAISTVSLPMLSKIKEDNYKLKEYYESMVKLIAFTIFPILAIIGLVAEPLINLTLTEKWLPTAPILKILCAIGAFYPMHVINLDLIKIKGRSDLFLKVGIIVQILTLLSILLSYRFGIIGMMWGLLILDVICFYIHTIYTKIIINYGFVKQIKDMLKYIIMTASMSIILVFIRSFLSSDVKILIILPAVGVLYYLLVAYFIKLAELRKLQSIFTKLIFPKSN
jgi:teichuronic acid exporter